MPFTFGFAQWEGFLRGFKFCHQEETAGAMKDTGAQDSRVGMSLSMIHAIWPPEKCERAHNTWYYKQLR